MSSLPKYLTIWFNFVNNQRQFKKKSLCFLISSDYLNYAHEGSPLELMHSKSGCLVSHLAEIDSAFHWS